MDEALKTVVTLLGGGGVTAIILGVLGFLKGRDSSPPQPDNLLKNHGLMFAALYADRSAVDRLSLAIEREVESRDRQTEAMRDNAAAIRERTSAMRRGR